MKVHRFFIRK